MRPRRWRDEGACGPWHRRARYHLGHSIQWRMVLVFLLLAGAMTTVFVVGAQRAFAIGWREAAAPLLADYVDHLAADLTGGGPTPERARAEALVQRLPLTVQISGPALNWSSHPTQADEDGRAVLGDARRAWLTRQTADGHRITFGLDHEVFVRKPRQLWVALTAVLLLSLAAWLYVRRTLRPLADIGAGAERFGRGDFSQPIPVWRPHKPDELGALAQTINTMGEDIRGMLDAKRGLLLAISHELRSPLTRARLHAELLPEDGEAAAGRQALLGNLQEMASLISDLLESERLATPHAALQREPTDLPALARGVLQELAARHPNAPPVTLQAGEDLQALRLDPARIRLLLRNLLDNALRHGADAATPPQLSLSRQGRTLTIRVRDHGPGVPPEQLQQLSQAFYRPDSARTRSAGGVGLGLYLCRLVAEAHGGQLRLGAAQPGLQAEATLPLEADPAASPAP